MHDPSVGRVAANPIVYDVSRCHHQHHSATETVTRLLGQGRYHFIFTHLLVGARAPRPFIGVGICDYTSHRYGSNVAAIGVLASTRACSYDTVTLTSQRYYNTTPLCSASAQPVRTKCYVQSDFSS